MEFKKNKKKKVVLDNKYILNNKIGEGGFSNVFDLKLKKRKKDQVDLCIKIFNVMDTQEEKEKIKNEAIKELNLSQQCMSDHLIKVFYHGEIIQRVPFQYIIMEHHSCDLFDFLNECSDFSLKDILRMGTEIATALLALHNENYLHLDVKPENILYNKQKNIWVLCDLSSCIQLNDSEALIKFDPAVTIQFAAPELIIDDGGDLLCSATDIYALACVLYLCIFEMDYIPELIIEDYDKILIFQQIQSKHQHHERILKCGPFNKYGIALNNEEVINLYNHWYTLYDEKKNLIDVIKLLRGCFECNPQLRYNSKQFLNHIKKLVI